MHKKLVKNELSNTTKDAKKSFLDRLNSLSVKFLEIVYYIKLICKKKLFKTKKKNKKLVNIRKIN